MDHAVIGKHLWLFSTTAQSQSATPNPNDLCAKIGWQAPGTHFFGAVGRIGHVTAR